MSIYIVDVHHQTHTWPGQRKPHPWDTCRTVVGVIATGPCLAPIKLPGTDTTVDCKARRSHHEQCNNCRITVQIRNVTYTTHTTVRAGQTATLVRLSHRACPVCGLPMAGQLTRHVLCAPASLGRAA